MELPNTEYTTIKTAYDYIKGNFPHLTKGFRMVEELIDDFREYPIAVFHWSSEGIFLGWGTSNGHAHKIPFPYTDCIELGEIK